MSKTKWTVEGILTEANNYEYRSKVAEGSPNTYTAASREKLLDIEDC